MVFDPVVSFITFTAWLLFHSVGFFFIRRLLPPSLLLHLVQLYTVNTLAVGLENHFQLRYFH